MRDKVQVNRKDRFRILHTELLPYEVPILFSNTNFYHYCAEEKEGIAPSLIKAILHSDLNYTVPYDYEILQGQGKRRTLSVIHPHVQTKFGQLYEDFNEVILFLCRKSDFSLRYPYRVASYFYEREFAREDDELRTETVDEEPEPFGSQPTHASSFFSYARYSQLHKFVDSQEFLNLELSFSHLLKFDLKRCFNSIYTHSFCWAVKGKEFSKDNVNAYSFDSEFDKLMQSANYNETNGIVIGPEASRIFAEVILQQIDLDIAYEVQSKGIPRDSYAIRRYIDDYFLFTTSPAIADSILDIAQNCLRKYKLYINESKTQRLTAPFVTSQTTAKRDVQAILGDTVLAWLNHLKKLLKDEQNAALDSSQAYQLRTPYRLAARLMRDLKIAVSRSNVSFDVVTGYALNSITRSMYRLLKAAESRRKALLSKEHQAIYQNVILVCVEIVFFFCSMDFRVRTTYLVSQFMLVVARLTRADRLFYDHLTNLMRIHIERIYSVPTRGRSGVEIYNLLIALKVSDPKGVPSAQRLISLSNPTSSGQVSKLQLGDYTYFDFVTMLFLSGDSPDHQPFVRAMEECLTDRFAGAGDFRKDTQLTLLFIDVLSCPYIERPTKHAIVRSAFERVLRRAAVPDTEVNEVINFVGKYLRFFDWGASVQLEKLLLKKQLNPAY